MFKLAVTNSGLVRILMKVFPEEQEKLDLRVYLSEASGLNFTAVYPIQSLLIDIKLHFYKPLSQVIGEKKAIKINTSIYMISLKHNLCALCCEKPLPMAPVLSKSKTYKIHKYSKSCTNHVSEVIIDIRSLMHYSDYILQTKK